MPVRDEPLQAADRQRALEAAPRALALARRVAGTTQRADERRRIQHQLERLLVFPAADQRDVPVGPDARRAGEAARRFPVTLDDRLLGHCLRERDVRRPAGHQVRVELVRHRDRAGLLTQLAAGAGRLVHVARLLAHGGVEPAVPVGRDPTDLAVGERRDVRVVNGARHLRRGDAAGAVQGREDLAEQDHLPAHAGFLLHEQHLVAHVAELQRGLHAADSGADDQDVVLHRSTHFGRPELGQRVRELLHVPGELLGADGTDGGHPHA